MLSANFQSIEGSRLNLSLPLRLFLYYKISWSSLFFISKIKCLFFVQSNLVFRLFVIGWNLKKKKKKEDKKRKKGTSIVLVWNARFLFLLNRYYDIEIFLKRYWYFYYIKHLPTRKTLFFFSFSKLCSRLYWDYFLDLSPLMFFSSPQI